MRDEMSDVDGTFVADPMPHAWVTPSPEALRLTRMILTEARNIDSLSIATTIPTMERAKKSIGALRRLLDDLEAAL